jgi:hypothetical protein
MIILRNIFAEVRLQKKKEKAHPHPSIIVAHQNITP